MSGETTSIFSRGSQRGNENDRVLDLHVRAHGRCWHSRNRMDFSRLEGLRDELCATLLFDLGLRRAHARNLLGFSGGSLSGTGLG